MDRTASITVFENEVEVQRAELGAVISEIHKSNSNFASLTEQHAQKSAKRDAALEKLTAGQKKLDEEYTKSASLDERAKQV